MGPDAMIFVFWVLNFKPIFSFFSFTFIKRLFNSSSLSAIRVVSSACLKLYLRLLIFSQQSWFQLVLLPAHCLSGLYQSVQLLSCIRLFATPWIAACQASLSITNSWSSLKLMSIESVMPSSAYYMAGSVLSPYMYKHSNLLRWVLLLYPF